ncbi:CDGSH iron-sulfur domain-containing protein 3, mitochondrial-like [Narcine bancroftii]|uniref:CDGSH iron-sulfur domain-containing protein 3, mitochondrial-like n=1 Tax=Narcine bancroftii TaxID=1343680 RepID=UPI003831CC68
MTREPKARSNFFRLWLPFAALALIWDLARRNVCASAMSAPPALRLALPALQAQIRSCWYSTTASPKGAVIAAKHPFKEDLLANKLYAWCACGHSQKQPFCDGSHRSIPLVPTPLRFRVKEEKTVFLCGCKQTKGPPYCDGTHKEDWVQRAALHTVPSLE